MTEALTKAQERMVEAMRERIESLIDETLDDYELEKTTRDGLRHDIGMLAQSVWQMSGNYVASHDTFPSEIAFANGRIVRLSISGEHLTVGSRAALATKEPNHA